jgi:uncharacterized caspase-like protein
MSRGGILRFRGRFRIFKGTKMTKHIRFPLLLGLSLALSIVSAPALPQPAAAVTAAERALAEQHSRRNALVIGNSAYKVSPLPNPVNDVRLVATSLVASGFNVIKLENATQEQMLKAITDFGDEIEKGGVGLFYFAGHGVQVGGQNFLVPVDARIEREEHIRTRAVNAQEVLDRMASAGNPLNLVFLDACRNDPFPRRTRAASSGLARMDAAQGMLISFATAPGSVAEDGAGRNSPYSRYLAESMKVPGLRVEDVLKRVRTRVREDTRGRQITWDNSSIEGDFYFVRAEPAPAATPAPKPEDPANAEIALWNSVQGSSDPRDFDVYLRRYPNGQFAELARRRLEAARPAVAARQPAPRDQAASTDSKAQPGGQVALARPSGTAATLPSLLPKVGDEWTYRFRSNWRNVGERVFVHRITAVSDSEIRETMSLQGSAGSGDNQVFGSAIAVVERGVAGVAVHELSPYLQAFSKIEPGMRWSPVQLALTDSGFGTWTAYARATGREKVRVSAGEFEAQRVELQANRSIVGGVSAIQTQAARIEHILWYAADTKRLIRHERTVLTGNDKLLDRDTVELLSYQVH